MNPSSQTVGQANKGKTPVAAGAAAAGGGVSDADADLEARLEALRRQ